MKPLAWMLVWVIAVIDVLFAYRCRHTFCEWEMNPVAVVVCSFVGIWGVIFFRFAILAAVTTVFCMAVRSKKCRPVFANALLTVWVSGHLALLGYYFFYMEDFVCIAEIF
jgi:hypothetical protein